MKSKLLVEDAISVEDIVLEYIINTGLKDHAKFARRLSEKIVTESPSSPEEVRKIIEYFVHPFYVFNHVTRKQFAERFPAAELVRESKIPRDLSTTRRSAVSRRRRGISKRIRLLILERDRYRCNLCGRGAAETKLEVDHKVPIAKGGKDSLNNLWTLCIDCNRGKSDLSL